MIDQDLERRYADCAELVEAWRIMNEMINRAMKNPDSIDPQGEEDFLRVKARIAMLHDSFMDSLKHDKAVGTNMIEIVNRAISLRVMNRMSEAEAKKLEIEWHEAYLLLNETVSAMNDRRQELGEINEVAFKMRRMVERAQTNFKAFLLSVYFKIIVGAVALTFIIWGVPALGIYDWDNLRDIRPLEPVVSGTLWAGRMAGLTTPYFSLSEFTDRAFKDPVSGLPHDNFRSERNKDDAADVITEVMLQGIGDSGFREDFRDLLKSADQYDAYKFVASGSRHEGFMYLFWFRRVGTASRVSAMLMPHQHELPSTFIVTQKANVITIVFSRHEDHRMRIQESRVDFMRP